MAVDNTSWDGPAVMSAGSASDDPEAFFRAVCAARKPDGDPATQDGWALPHHKGPGEPPNADGVRAGLSREPQTDGIDHEKAASHLQAHFADIKAAGLSDEGELRTLDLPEEPLQTLSVSKRILGLRLLPYNEIAESKYGPLLFEPGAFGSVDPKTVRLRMDHADPPTGLGRSFEDKPDAPYMDFDVSRTARGDEQLTLANDGVSRGVSVGFAGNPRIETRNGRRVQVYPPNSATLTEVSTTWLPTFKSASVMYVLSTKDKEGERPQMAETPETPAAVVADDNHEQRENDAAIARTLSTLAAQNTTTTDALTKMLERIAGLEEHGRAEFEPPTGDNKTVKPTLITWADYTMRRLSGQNVTERELRELALADVITDDNLGVVPESFSTDLIGIINPVRPFLSSTRQTAAPASGMTITVPVLGTRATVGVQSEEKSDIDSTGPTVTTASFDAETIAGGADVSIQLIRRSSPAFMDLLVQELGEAYAIKADEEAITALLGSSPGVTAGGAPLDPEDLTIGEAWLNSLTNYKRPPDHIWLSSTAVQEFLDAKANTTNAPLYGNLQANFSAGSGTGGNISGLTPVYVPALDGSGVDVLIGPSAGFAWAEDGTFTLQVDVPSKLGRDIALGSIMFFMPRYPAAFTSYVLAS